MTKVAKEYISALPQDFKWLCRTQRLIRLHLPATFNMNVNKLTGSFMSFPSTCNTCKLGESASNSTGRYSILLFLTSKCSKLAKHPISFGNLEIWFREISNILKTVKNPISTGSPERQLSAKFRSVRLLQRPRSGGNDVSLAKKENYCMAYFSIPSFSCLASEKVV